MKACKSDRKIIERFELDNCYYVVLFEENNHFHVVSYEGGTVYEDLETAKKFYAKEVDFQKRIFKEYNLEVHCRNIFNNIFLFEANNEPKLALKAISDLRKELDEIQDDIIEESLDV